MHIIFIDKVRYSLKLNHWLAFQQIDGRTDMARSTSLEMLIQNYGVCVIPMNFLALEGYYPKLIYSIKGYIACKSCYSPLEIMQWQLQSPGCSIFNFKQEWTQSLFTYQHKIDESLR